MVPHDRIQVHELRIRHVRLRVVLRADMRRVAVVVRVPGQVRGCLRGVVHAGDGRELGLVRQYNADDRRALALRRRLRRPEGREQERGGLPGHLEGGLPQVHFPEARSGLYTRPRL